MKPAQATVSVHFGKTPSSKYTRNSSRLVKFSHEMPVLMEKPVAKRK